MYKVNIEKVIEKIYGKGYNKSSFAKACNISRNTLADYLKNPNKIPYAIISVMAKTLCETEAEARDIFFTEKLS